VGTQPSQIAVRRGGITSSQAPRPRQRGLARTHDAVCTIRLHTALELHYRGQLDESRTTLVPDARRELFGAMCRIAETGKGPAEQQASTGRRFGHGSRIFNGE
jgi:hypothetical protein